MTTTWPEGIGAENGYWTEESLSSGEKWNPVNFVKQGRMPVK